MSFGWMTPSDRDLWALDLAFAQSSGPKASGGPTEGLTSAVGFPRLPTVLLPTHYCCLGTPCIRQVLLENQVLLYQEAKLTEHKAG